MKLNKSKEEEKELYSSEILEALFEKNYETMKKEYISQKKEWDKEFLITCQCFLEKCKKEQENKQRGKVAFLNFNYLRWAILQERLEVQFTAYEKEYYLAPVIAWNVWIPKRLNLYFQEDLKQVNIMAKSKLIGYSFLDYEKIREEYSNLYYFLIGQYCKNMAETVAAMESYQELDKTEDCKIVFGGYMDQGIVIYPVT